MKLTDIKSGNLVFLDNGFTCVKPGFHKVNSDKEGLYVCCDHGKHYLNGQEDENGDLVGVS